MNKLLKIIVVLVIMATFGEVSHGAEYLKSVEFTEKNIAKNITWSGKEWITDTYPPKISQNSVDFVKTEENENVKTELKNYRYIYVWTGNDYLVYQSIPDYRKYDRQKYMYRLSADFQQILNIYEIPNWITKMAFTDDKIFIETKNVYPQKDGERVLGISYGDYGIYYSTDCFEWRKFDFEGYDLIGLNNQLFIGNSLYFDGDITKILYETYSGYPKYKVGQYLCGIDYKNEYKTDNNTVLAFSKDGIYWVYMIVDRANGQGVSEVGDEILIQKDYGTYYVGDKEKVFSQLREKLPNNPVYVKFDGNILGFDVPPIIEDGSTLVPMRFLFEQMGADVEWDSETQTATATIDSKAVTFSIDNVNARINNKSAKMDVPARLVNGKTMVPLRFLSENMGYDVDWDADSRTAIIKDI